MKPSRPNSSARKMWVARSTERGSRIRKTIAPTPEASTGAMRHQGTRRHQASRATGSGGSGSARGTGATSGGRPLGGAVTDEKTARSTASKPSRWSLRGTPSGAAGAGSRRRVSRRSLPARPGAPGRGAARRSRSAPGPASACGAHARAGATRPPASAAPGGRRPAREPARSSPRPPAVRGGRGGPHAAAASHAPASRSWPGLHARAEQRAWRGRVLMPGLRKAIRRRPRPAVPGRQPSRDARSAGERSTWLSQ